MQRETLFWGCIDNPCTLAVGVRRVWIVGAGECDNSKVCREAMASSASVRHLMIC